MRLAFLDPHSKGEILVLPALVVRVIVTLGTRWAVCLASRRPLRIPRTATSFRRAFCCFNYRSGLLFEPDSIRFQELTNRHDLSPRENRFVRARQSNTKWNFRNTKNRDKMTKAIARVDLSKPMSQWSGSGTQG